MNNELTVQEKIIYFAEKEFLNYGFKDASLRNIAAAAGMTTGAIYTYFKDKNALFEGVVDPIYTRIAGIFEELSTTYYDSNTIVSDITFKKSLTDLKLIYDFIYQYFDIFRILLVGAEGSSRSDFVHMIVDHEVKHTIAYLEKLKEIKSSDTQIDSTVIHAISEGYINALLEPVRHNMSYEEAIKNLNILVIFHIGGWNSVFDALFNKMDA